MIAPSYRFYPSLLVFLLVTLWVLIAAGTVEYFQWQSLIVPAIIIHVGVIVVCLGATICIFKGQKTQFLLEVLSCKKTQWYYYCIALLMALSIWLADFWLQLFFFLDDGKIDGLELQQEVMHFGLFSIVLAYCILGPMAEELLFRGVLLKGLVTRLNSGWSIFISSIIFAAIHFSINDFMTLFIAAAGYALLTLKSRSLFPAMLAHMINNSVTVYYLLTL